jgi:hypothetical protein
MLMAGCGAAPQATPVVTPSPTAAPTPTTLATAVSSTSAATTTITGDVGGADLKFTFEMPGDWTSFANGARSVDRAHQVELGGSAFFVSVVDNTFEDPCAHVERSPEVGSTTDDVVAALGTIPSTTATQPLTTTIAGLDATLVELTIPGSLPCNPQTFFLWQDSPGNYWWLLATNERIRVWVIDQDGTPVVISARSWPETSAALVTQMDTVLNSIKFVVP